MPERGARLRNAMPMFILQSPLNPIMSGKYAIIEFTGRKSGKHYRTPVAYVREENRVLLSTDSPWWRNLRGGAAVSMILRGKRVSGVGRTVADPERGAEILRALVDAIPSYAGPAELEKTDGRVSDAEIARAIADGRVSIEVELESGS